MADVENVQFLLYSILIQEEELINTAIMKFRIKPVKSNSLRRFRAIMAHRDPSNGTQTPPEIAVGDAEDNNIVNNNNFVGHKGMRRNQR